MDPPDHKTLSDSGSEMSKIQTATRDRKGGRRDRYKCVGVHRLGGDLRRKDKHHRQSHRVKGHKHRALFHYMLSAQLLLP